jgi:hypothetical protein
MLGIDQNATIYVWRIASKAFENLLQKGMQLKYKLVRRSGNLFKTRYVVPGVARDF